MPSFGDYDWPSLRAQRAVFHWVDLFRLELINNTIDPAPQRGPFSNLVGLRPVQPGGWAAWHARCASRRRIANPPQINNPGWGPSPDAPQASCGAHNPRNGQAPFDELP